MMLFAFFASLLALTSASPTPVTPGLARSDIERVQSRAAQEIKHCDFGYFEDHTDDKSPWSSDCDVLTNNIAGDGDWELRLNGEFRQIAQYNSCAIGVQAYGCTGKIGDVRNSDPSLKASVVKRNS